MPRIAPCLDLCLMVSIYKTCLAAASSQRGAPPCARVLQKCSEPAPWLWWLFGSADTPVVVADGCRAEESGPIERTELRLREWSLIYPFEMELALSGLILVNLGGRKCGNCTWLCLGVKCAHHRGLLKPRASAKCCSALCRARTCPNWAFSSLFGPLFLLLLFLLLLAVPCANAA